MSSQPPQEEATSTSFPQSIPELEADLENTRLQMSVTVDELVHVLSPSHQLDVAKERVHKVVEQVKNDAEDLVDNARTGDQRSIIILGGIAIGVAAVASFCIYKIVK